MEIKAILQIFVGKVALPGLSPMVCCGEEDVWQQVLYNIFIQTTQETAHYPRLNVHQGFSLLEFLLHA